MPSTEERESQPVMEDPCPRCGSPLVLRNWKGRFFAKCKNPGCPFEYATDHRGNRVGADSAEAGPKAAGERTHAEAGAPELGACPKCGKGQLAVRSGSYGTFVSCSERCGLTYSSDAQGVPTGGTCKACRGPVKQTQSGSKVCALCGAWQDEKKAAAPAPAPETRPAKPKPAQCPRCARPLKEVFTRRQKWVYRCDTCEAWYDV